MTNKSVTIETKGKSVSVTSLRQCQALTQHKISFSLQTKFLNQNLFPEFDNI